MRADNVKASLLPCYYVRAVSLTQNKYTSLSHMDSSSISVSVDLESILVAGLDVLTCENTFSVFY